MKKLFYFLLLIFAQPVFGQQQTPASRILKGFAIIGDANNRLSLDSTLISPLTNGEATTANGTAVDLGGTHTGSVNIVSGGGGASFNIDNIGQTGISFGDVTDNNGGAILHLASFQAYWDGITNHNNTFGINKIPTNGVALDVLGNSVFTGSITMVDGNEQAGFVMTSDANGLGSWQAASSGSGWGLTGNAGTTAGTNFIGTTDVVDFVTKTGGIERYRTKSYGVTGFGTSNPYSTLQIKPDTIIRSGFRVEGKDLLSDTTRAGDWNNTTNPIVVDITLAKGYLPAGLHNNIYVGSFIRIGTELMKVTKEVNISGADQTYTLSRGVDSTTIVAHADGEVIYLAFPYQIYHIPQKMGQTGGGFGNGGAICFNCDTSRFGAMINIDKQITQGAPGNPVLDINSAGYNYMHLHGDGKVLWGGGLTPAPTSTAFFEFGAGISWGTEMLFNNTAHINFAKAGDGGRIRNTGNFYLSLEGSINLWGLTIDVAPYFGGDDLVFFGGLQNSGGGFGTVIANYVNGTGAEIFAVIGKASDTATTNMFVNQDTSGLVVNDVYLDKEKGGVLSIQGYQVNCEINTTAGDAATIDKTCGRFRKDATGTTFTLTNGYVTANSTIFLTQADAALDATATRWTVSAGAGSATITFDAAPTADFNMNFEVRNRQ